MYGLILGYKRIKTNVPISQLIGTDKTQKPLRYDSSDKIKKIAVNVRFAPKYVEATETQGKLDCAKKNPLQVFVSLFLIPIAKAIKGTRKKMSQSMGVKFII
jgi:hypothetical protein